MPSMQQERSPAKHAAAGSPRVAPSLAKGLQEDLTKALSLALSQLEQLGRPGSRRGRLAQRKAQEFVESALETSQMLLADMQQAAAPTGQESLSPKNEQPRHELLVTLQRQLAASSNPKIQALPLVYQGQLPELPRIVARTLSEVTLHLLGSGAHALSSLRIQALTHGLSVQLLCKPMEAQLTADLRRRLEADLAGGAATRLALVGAGIGRCETVASDVLISIVWPALSEDAQ